jgi:hypothetical protein
MLSRYRKGVAGVAMLVASAVLGAVGVASPAYGATTSTTGASASLMPSQQASTAATLHATRSLRQVRNRWTVARMQAATPMSEPQERRSAQPQTHALLRRSAPGVASPMTRTTNASTRAFADDFSQSQVWTAHGVMPATTVGKLYFDTPGGAAECTASVISSANRSLIWTAGHCVTDGNGHWYSNWLFVPDYSNGNSPVGSWIGKSVSTPSGYFNGADSDRDFAAISLWNNAASTSVADVTGSQGYIFNGGYDWNVYEFGYPYDTHPSSAGITGQDLRYCVGQTWRPGFWIFAPDQEAIHCDQGHGASGGPWLYDLELDRGWGYLVGNVSYHPDDNSDEERSPHFGDAAVNVYHAQQGA